VRVPDFMSDEIATLIVTAGTAIYGLDVLGGLVAGQSLVVTGAGPIGLLGVAAAKALGAYPVILTDIVNERLAIGTQLGADHVINAAEQSARDAIFEINGGRGVDFVLECSGAPSGVDEAIKLVNRGGRICLAAFAHEPQLVDVCEIVTNNIYLFGIRGEGKSAVRRAASLMAQKKLDASPIHTHTFPFEELETGLRYAREKLDGAIKIVITNR